MDEAYRRLSLTNNFPEFTGRVCPALCEGSCTLGMHDPAVTIRNIECHIIDTMFAENKVKPRLPEKSTEKTCCGSRQRSVGIGLRRPA